MQCWNKITPLNCVPLLSLSSGRIFMTNKKNWKIIFLSRERHWRPLINRIPQEKSCRKDFTPNNSVIADGNRISLLSFTSLYNHVYQNTLNFVQSCKVQYDSLSQWRSSIKFECKKKYVEPIDENAMLAYLRVPKH